MCNEVHHYFPREKVLACFYFIVVSGQVRMSSPNTQPPASNAIANGPVTGMRTSPQGPPYMGSQPLTNATPPAPQVGTSQRLSAPLSPGAALANGPSSQTPPTSSNVQGGVTQPGSAFTPVTSSHPSQPSQNLSPTAPLPVQHPVQGLTTAHPQAQQTQFGQTTNYTGQTQRSPLQTPGMSPTGNQPLSALHSNKPKRPVMPMNTGYPGQRGSPSPRSTPPPPVGPPGPAMSQGSTPPPPSNLQGSSMPQAPYSSPPSGYPLMGQDTQAGGRPISSRRRMYPSQVCSKRGDSVFKCSL